MRSLLFFLVGSLTTVAFTVFLSSGENLAQSPRPALTAESLGYPPFTKKSTVHGIPACPRKVTVAVIDTGVDYTHARIAPYMWDSVGYDFVHDFHLPYDTHGHGTHIAGIIARIADGVLYPYSFGSQSVVEPLITNCHPDVKIMGLKYYDNMGFGYNNLLNTVRSIRFAIKHKVDVINYSGGGSEPAESEKVALTEALNAGILVVAAAGNEGQNSDKVPYYPASYKLDNMISVGSVNKFNRLLPSSNYGKTVDVAAPGLMVLSYLPNQRQGTMSGTSQATAYVSGVAAVLMTLRSDATYYSAKDVLLKTAQPSELNVLGYGVLNPRAAVKKFLTK